jgi:hypothetical protein
MAEYSTDDASRAEAITLQLFQPERPEFELEESLSIADVEQDTLDFRDQMETIEAVGQRVPAARADDDDLVPIDIRSLAPSMNMRYYDRYDPYWPEGAYYRLRDFYERRYPNIPTMAPEEARSAYRFRLVDFLATRIAGVRGLREGNADGAQAVLLQLPQRLGGQSVPTSGCTFVVSTNSSGLNVVWSGYYWRSPVNFGGPTTPCQSVLQSGTYAFGVTGGAYKGEQWYRPKVKLPGRPSLHLNY